MKNCDRPNSGMVDSASVAA